MVAAGAVGPLVATRIRARERETADMTANLISDEIVADAITIRRDLHAHPELGFQERRTAGIVADRLKALGFETHTGIAETGVVGLLRGAKDGPTIMLRADMDALPMAEENDVPYRSTHPGTMHACGHDAHVAMLLGAAAILRDRTDSFAGRIAVVFQPAEEGGGGAREMIREGILGRFEIRRAYGLHVTNVLPSGVFGTRPGPLLASVDQFDLTVDGAGGHGGMPHRSVDPVVIAADLVGAFQRIVSREVDPIDTAVVTIGAINGGTTYNVIPPRVSMKGTVRSFNQTTRASLEASIRRIAEHTCAAGRATCSIDWQASYPVTVNDPSETVFLRETLAARFGKARAIEIPPVMGSEDFSYFANEVPACFAFLGTGDATHAAPNHHPAFDIDESAISAGIAAHVDLALGALARSS